MDFKDRAKKLKSDIPAVFIALKKKETPIISKIFAGITIVYALSPIDLIPDFIPVIGLIDDLILLPILIAITIKFIPEEIFKQCRSEAENLWNGGKPKKWYFALPIILIWVILIFFIINLVFS
ncbi:MAG: YkvA family protein [Clostridiaceae bacterium]